MSKLNAWLRAKQKVFLVIVCCVCMVVFVVGPGMTKIFEPDRTEGGEVFGEKVSGKHVWTIARNLRIFSGDNAPPEAEIFANAWQLVIMDHEAGRFGVTANDSEVVDFLASNFPASDGGVDEAQYVAFLKQNGATRTDYEKTLRLLIRSYKLRMLVQQQVVLPEDEAWMRYTQDRQRVKARYVMLGAATLAPLVSPDNAGIQAFYEQYKNTPQNQGPYGAGYQIPEKVKIEYILASNKDFEDKVTVTEEEILKYYEDHKADYVVNEEDSDDTDAEENASDSDDPAADATTEDVTENAEEKEVAYKPLADVRSEIEKTLREEAAKQAVDEAMKSVNDAVWKALEVPFGSREAGTVDLQAIAKEFNLTCTETDFFSADECNKILPGATELSRRAFGKGTSGIGNPSSRLDAKDGKFIFRVLESQPPTPPPFDTVEKKVIAHYRLKLAADLAQTLANHAVEANNFDMAVETVKTALTDLVEEEEPQVQTQTVEGEDGNISEVKKTFAAAPDIQKYFTLGESNYFEHVMSFNYGGQVLRFHNGAGLPAGADSANFAETAFNLKDDEIGFAEDADQAPRYFFVLERIGIEFPTRQEFENNKDSEMQRLLAKKREEALKSWFTDLLTRANPSPEVKQLLGILPEWAG